MKDKIIQFIKNFFQDKTIAFYIALSIAVLSIITPIIYAVSFGATEYMSWLAFAFMLAAAAAFITLAVFRLSSIGAAVMAALDFAAFILFIANIYNYFLDNVMEGIEGAGFTLLIVCAALMFVSFVGANVTVWLRLQKIGQIDTAKAN